MVRFNLDSDEAVKASLLDEVDEASELDDNQMNAVLHRAKAALSRYGLTDFYDDENTTEALLWTAAMYSIDESNLYSPMAGWHPGNEFWSDEAYISGDEPVLKLYSELVNSALEAL